MASGNPPLANVDPMRAIILIPRSKPPKLPDSFSPAIRDFVDLCLCEEPDEVSNTCSSSNDYTDMMDRDQVRMNCQEQGLSRIATRHRGLYYEN